MHYSRLGPVVILGLGILGILLFLERFEFPDDTFLLREFQDAGHTPLFGLLSLLILPLSRMLPAPFKLKWRGHYALALAVTMALAVVSEALQIIGPRDADLLDLLRDLAGAVSFLAIRRSFDRRALAENSARSAGIDLRWLLGGTILFLVSLAPLAIWQAAYVHRDRAFPRIATFDSFLGNKFLAANGAELKIMASPDGWSTPDDNRVGRLVLRPGGYPGLVLSETYPDWRGYDYLEFSVFLDRPDTVRLALRINDRRHNNEISDRYHRSLSVAPGLNQFSFPLAEVATAPRAREMDMTAIRTVVIFAARPEAEIEIYVDDIRLRKEGL